MTDYSDDFNEHADSLREEREQSDFDNQQHTIAGLQTGHQTKHGLRKDEIDPHTGEKKRGIVEAIMQQTLEELLRNNPAYRKAYENLVSTIRTAQTAAQTTLKQVEAALADKQELWDSKMSKAAKLPDGTPVFKDKHGNVQTLDGEIIPPEQAAKIKWPEDAPLLEGMLLLQQDIFNLKATRDELLGIETELGEIYVRNNRNDKPATPDAMKRDTGRADDLENGCGKLALALKNINRHKQQLRTLRILMLF